MIISGESSYKAIRHEVLTNRRDELEEHAAKGRTMAVDEEIVEGLNIAAGSLFLAVAVPCDEYDRVGEELLSTLSDLRSAAQKHVDEND